MFPIRLLSAEELKILTYIRDFLQAFHDSIKATKAAEQP